MTTLGKPRFPCEGELELFLEVIVGCDMSLFSYVGFCNFRVLEHWELSHLGLSY
jgi:hypothetical protein